MGLHCEFQSLKLALGPPWDASLTKCCLQAGGLSTPRPRSTSPSFPGLIPTTTASSELMQNTSYGILELIKPLLQFSTILFPAGGQSSGGTTAREDICNLFPGQLCSQICISEGDSFRCDCETGYRLLPDRKSCLLDNSNQITTERTPTPSGWDKGIPSSNPNQCPVGFIFNALTQICDG